MHPAGHSRDLPTNNMLALTTSTKFALMCSAPKAQRSIRAHLRRATAQISRNPNASAVNAITSKRQGRWIALSALVCTIIRVPRTRCPQAHIAAAPLAISVEQFSPLRRGRLPFWQRCTTWLRSSDSINVVARRRTRPALRFVNLADAMCLFRSERVSFFAGLWVSGQLDSASGQPRNLIGQTLACDGLGLSSRRQQALRHSHCSADGPLRATITN